MRVRQKGATTVEFAFVGALFFIVLFGVIEVGRALFVWNTLTEATRRGARVAAVCDINNSAIKRATVFGTSADPDNSPVIGGLTTSDVQLTYLDQNGTKIDSPGSGINFNTAIRYVRVAITGYQHTLLIPYLSRILLPPSFETTLPRESLGVCRDWSEGTFSVCCPPFPP